MLKRKAEILDEDKDEQVVSMKFCDNAMYINKQHMQFNVISVMPCSSCR